MSPRPRLSNGLADKGSVAPGKMGGHKPRILQGAHADWLRERIPHSDFTLRGLVAELAERGLKVDYRSVWTFVHEEKLSFKKTVLPSEQECADIARKRARWKSYQGVFAQRAGDQIQGAIRVSTRGPTRFDACRPHHLARSPAS